jgi:predicted nucleic acid-binding protein
MRNDAEEAKWTMGILPWATSIRSAFPGNRRTSVPASSRGRDGQPSLPALDLGNATARNRLQALVESWIEIDDLRTVRQRAQRLLETHPLRSADALQLAAALVLVSDRPERVSFVTLDDRLGEAAEREGFEVVGVG